MSSRPFSLRQLQYAVAVTDTLGFRRAAARCHVSQPSLSAQLAPLETMLLVGRARRLLADADELLTAAQHFRDPLTGTLRNGVIPTVSPYRLPALVPLFRAPHLVRVGHRTNGGRR